MKKKKTVKKKNKKNDFFDKVYKIVAKIPYGKVATYGDIAEACGIRSSARTVGWALNGAKESGLPFISIPLGICLTSTELLH